MQIQVIATLPADLQMRLQEKKKKFDLLHRFARDIVKEIDERRQTEYFCKSNKIDYGERKGAITLHGEEFSNTLAEQNHRRGLAIIQEMVSDRYHKLSEHDLRYLHLMIRGGLVGHSGRYRQYDLSVTGARFTPPAFCEVPDRMKELACFINENGDKLKPVELAAHAHYHLVLIHPFEDGNGRLSRLLLNLILLKNGYPFVAISNHEKKKYLECLRFADSGNFESFQIYIAKCVEQTLEFYIYETGG